MRPHRSSATAHAIAYGEVGYEDLFSTDDSYTAKLAFNTAHAVTINDDLQASGLYFKAGVGGYLDNNIKLTGEYTLSLQNGNGDVQSGRLRVTIPLSSDARSGSATDLAARIVSATAIGQRCVVGSI